MSSNEIKLAIGYILQFVVTASTVAIALLLILAISASAYRISLYLFPNQKTVYFLDCTEDGKHSADLCQELKHRFDLFFRMPPPRYAPGVLGLGRELPIDISAVGRHQSKELEQISISGVDLAAITKLIRTTVPPGGFVFRLDLASAGDMVTASPSLRRLFNSIDTGAFHATTLSANSSTDARDRLIDTTLFWLAKHLHGEEFIHDPEVEALYHRGRRLIDLYLASGKRADLEFGLGELRRAVFEQPQWERALLYLGFALAEFGETRESVEILQSAWDQAEERLSSESKGESPGEESSNSPASTHDEQSARIGLLLGQQLARLSRMQATDRAIGILEKVLERSGDSAEIAVRAHARLAETHSRRIWLARFEGGGFERIRRKEVVDEGIAKSKDSLDKAHEALERLESNGKAGEVDKDELEIRLDAVRGIRNFRRAHYEQDATMMGAASETLRTVHARWPRDSEVLFMLGTLLGLRRFDSGDSHLDEAISLLSRAADLRPSDQLIRLQLVQAKMRTAFLRRERSALTGC